MTIGLVKAFNLTESKNLSSSNQNTRIEQATPSPRALPLKNPNMLNILTMGDSIAKGTGAADRQGFDAHLKSILKTKIQKEVVLNNIAVDGQESAGLLLQLSNSNTLPLLKNSDLIMISIGGNNLRPLREVNSDIQSNTFTEIMDSYLSDLKKILQIIRVNNKTVNIMFLGLYNPYASDNLPENTRLFNTWNSNTQQLIETEEKSIFVPTYDLFKLNIQKYVYVDGLHPNSTGYKAIAQRIYESLESLFTV